MFKIEKRKQLCVQLLSSPKIKHLYKNKIMSIDNDRLTDRRLWGEVLDMAILNRNVNIVRQLVLCGVQVEKHHMMTFFGHDGSEFDLFNVLAQSFYKLDDHGEEDDEEEIGKTPKTDGEFARFNMKMHTEFKEWDILSSTALVGCSLSFAREFKKCIQTPASFNFGRFMSRVAAGGLIGATYGYMYLKGVDKTLDDLNENIFVQKKT